MSILRRPHPGSCAALFIVVVGLMAGLAGCTPTVAPDAGSPAVPEPDAGSPAVAEPDAGSPAVVEPDAGTPANDAGTPEPFDAGNPEPVDAGGPAPVDGGNPDCGYPAGAVEPMALNEVVTPYSWPEALDSDNNNVAIDLDNVPCATDDNIDWSAFDVLLFVSIPAW